MELFLQLSISIAALSYAVKIGDEVKTKADAKRNNRRMQEELAELTRKREEEVERELEDAKQLEDSLKK